MWAPPSTGPTSAKADIKARRVGVVLAVGALSSLTQHSREKDLSIESIMDDDNFDVVCAVDEDTAAVVR
tara:strand:+ start:360 stop:566 length:207 start_codon:yes stop_codon:yes gene_type:complete